MSAPGGIQAVILAGGIGVRLRPLTLEVPKPMVPVAGKPYLEHQLRLLATQEIRDLVILTGHLGDQIEQYFGDGSGLGISIRYSWEQTPLGTGGALLQARRLLADDFLVIYGDSYLPIDYAAVIESLRNSAAQGVLVVYDNRHGDTSVSNNIALDADGWIKRYEKDSGRPEGLTHVDAGVGAFRRSALRPYENVTGKWPLEGRMYTELIKRRQLLAHETGQRFYDIGTPERLAAIERYFTR